MTRSGPCFAELYPGSTRIEALKMHNARGECVRFLVGFEDDFLRMSGTPIKSDFLKKYY